jgi:HAD superfamily hydrolase (TIGR01509 family)
LTIGRYSAAIFDLDGTLVQSEHLHRLSWNEPLARRGIVIDDATYYRDFAGMPGMLIIRDHIGLQGESAEMLYQDVTAAYWAIATDQVLPTAGLLTFLSRITNIPKAVCTSAQRDSASRMLDLLELTSHFTTVVTATDVVNGKPDPEPFLLAASRLNVANNHCVAFEDSANGLRSARSAGMYCIGVGDGVERYPNFADLWIVDFSDDRLKDVKFNTA